MSKIILTNITSKEGLKISDGNTLNLSKSNSFLQLPKGSTAERPSSAKNGDIRYNTDYKTVEYYSNSVWEQIQVVKDYDQISQAGLVLNIDASSQESYPETGIKWYDKTTYMNDGELFNTPTFDSSDLSFDFNTTDYVVFQNTPSLNITQALTISSWFYPRGTAGYLYLKGRTDSDHYNPLLYANGGYGWVGPNGRTFYLPQSTIVPLNQWNNLTVTHISGQDPIVYVNGIRQTALAYTEGNGTRALGTNSWRANINSDVERGTTSGYDGKIAVLHLYNRSLSSGEVWKNYAALAPRFGIDPIPPIVTNGLVLYLDAANYQSYPRSGTTWTDLSSQSNNGTLVNSVGYSIDNGGTLTFNGSNTRVSTDFKPSGARSYFVWVKYNKTTSLPNGYSLTGTQQQNAYNYLGIQNGGAFYYYIGTVGGTISSTVLSPNIWYQQGLVLFSDGSRKAYLNGIEIFSGTGGVGGTATAEFSVGCVNQNHWVDGNISVVTQYNRELSQAEITQNFNALRTRYGI